MKTRVPIAELVAAVRALGEAPSPRELRALLPRGWVPEDDGLHARRDLRVFFGQGWMLALCLVVFGSVGAVFVLGAVPRGWSGVLRVLLMLGVVWLAAGIAGPLITRALKKSG